MLRDDIQSVRHQNRGDTKKAAAVRELLAAVERDVERGYAGRNYFYPGRELRYSENKGSTAPAIKALIAGNIIRQAGYSPSKGQYQILTDEERAAILAEDLRNRADRKAREALRQIGFPMAALRRDEGRAAEVLEWLTQRQ